MGSSPILIWAICLSLAATAAGHGMMVSPRPRTGTRNAGNNKGRGTAPCGRGTQLQTQGSPQATYEPGQSVDIGWRIDAAHGGTCRISLSTSGGGVPTGFQDLTGTFNCARRGGADSKTVTIPQDASCDNCVLQWYWRGDADYYNCMDVSIKPSTPPTPPPPPVPTPAPKPMPPEKVEEVWSLWMDGKCLVVKDNKNPGQLSTDAEWSEPGVMTGLIDAQHDGADCSPFSHVALPGVRGLFRLCECKDAKSCMCANQALTFIPSTPGGGVDASGAWEVRIEDAARVNKNQLFDEKGDGVCVVTDPSKCLKLDAWKAPPPTRRRRRRAEPKPPIPGEPAKPCPEQPASRRRRRRSTGRRRTSRKKPTPGKTRRRRR